MNHKTAVITAILQLVSGRFFIRQKSGQELCVGQYKGDINRVTPFNIQVEI